MQPNMPQPSDNATSSTNTSSPEPVVSVVSSDPVVPTDPVPVVSSDPVAPTDPVPVVSSDPVAPTDPVVSLDPVVPVVDDQLQYEQNTEFKQKPDSTSENKKKKYRTSTPKPHVENIVMQSDNLIMILKSNKKIKESKYTSPEYIRLASNYISSYNQDSFVTNQDGTITIKSMDIFVKLVSELNDGINSCYPKNLECDKCKQVKLYSDFKELSTSSTGRQKTCNLCKSGGVKLDNNDIDKLEIS